MARMPGTVWQGEKSPRRKMARYDVVCVHTIVGYAPAHAAHFSVKADGTIIQSRDTAYQSAANLDGNHRVIAIENEDHGPRFGGTPRLPGWVPLTPEQVEANARILAWAHDTHGIPLQLCPDSRPGSRGLGYHRQGIDGNFGGYRFPGRVSGGEKWTSHYGKVCPTDARIAQLPEILELARPAKPKPPAAVHREARAHISLKHSLNPTLIGRYVAAVVKEDDCTSFTTTESSRAYRRAIKQRLGDKWIVRKSGEYVIGIRRDTFKPLASRLPVLTRLSKVYAGRQEWRDFFVSRRLYVHRATGRLYAPSAGHAPSGVQNGDYWKVANWRGVKASKRGLTRLGVWATRVQRNRVGVVVALGIDTNLDHHRVAWRRRVSDRLELASMWDRTRPASNVGTHGTRLIDAIYSNAPMTDPRISSVRRPRGVDHKAVVVDLHFAPIAPNQKEK